MLKKKLHSVFIGSYMVILTVFAFSLTLRLLATTCLLLITFENSLDPDQDRQEVGPDLDLNCLTL